MNTKKIIASAAAALLIATAPSMADNENPQVLGAKVDNSQHQDMDHDRYRFSIMPGEVMLFQQPLSFTGEIIASTDSHKTLRAQNGMTVKVPNQALMWDGDRNMFDQSTNIGDQVVVHMRLDEPYRIMETPMTLKPMVTVGSYDGVFFFSDGFIEDLDIQGLDDDITASMESPVVYDEDLKSADGMDESVE